MKKQRERKKEAEEAPVTRENAIAVHVSKRHFSGWLMRTSAVPPSCMLAKEPCHSCVPPMSLLVSSSILACGKRVTWVTLRGALTRFQSTPKGTFFVSPVCSINALHMPKPDNACEIFYLDLKVFLPQRLQDSLFHNRRHDDESTALTEFAKSASCT